MWKAAPPQPAVEARQPPDRASWPCRFCHSRQSVLITLRQASTLVCFCGSCEQGWITDDQGKPRDC